MQTLVQIGKVDQLEQEVFELREEVTTLRAEVEKLISLVSSLMATKDPPLVQQRPLPLCQPMCIKRPRQQVPQQFIPQNQVPQRFIPQNQAPQQPHPQYQQIAPIPVKYADLLPQFLEKNLVQTKAPPPVPARLPAWYRPDLFCDFHQGAPGHDIEHCNAMKKAVQNLIRTNRLT